MVAEQDTSTVAEHIKPSSAKQVMPHAEAIMPLVEDLLSTPPTSQNVGYGHGVSIDSMIITPRVPTLGE